MLFLNVKPRMGVVFGCGAYGQKVTGSNPTVGKGDFTAGVENKTLNC